MKPLSFMLVAGEASGDLLAAELVPALRQRVLALESKPTRDAQPLRTELAPQFFGAGGSRMAAAGVELAVEMTRHAVIGISDVLKNYLKFRRLFRQLFELAIERKPDVIIGVDYGGLNLRLAHAVKQHVRKRLGWFQPWNPKIVQYISPQVWASRPGRAQQMAGNHDLVLSIFPFERDWYAKHAPNLRVEFVGHPMVERFIKTESGKRKAETPDAASRILLLPGSRASELRRHLPVMLEALKRIQQKRADVRARVVLPDESAKAKAEQLGALSGIELQIGDLPQALAQSDIAIAKTGTVTVECAFFGVPTVTLYRLSWLEHQYAKRIVTVKWATMPNILANEEVFPEFIQDAATPENIANAALDLLNNEQRQREVKATLSKIVASLGGPGANARAADLIAGLLQ